MSGNRGPRSSSFAPTRGFVPNALMWSSMSMRLPDLKDLSLPPAAFVTMTGRHGVAFVEMDTPGENDRRNAAHGPRHERPRVPDHGRRRESRDVAVRDRDALVDAGGEVAEAG